MTGMNIDQNHATFLGYVQALRPKLDRLLALVPVTPSSLPRQMPRSGVYLLSEADRHLYVGRSNNIRRRIGRHSLPGATDRMAAFAFRLAREATGNLQASYKKGEGSRAGLMQNRTFVDAFTSAKARIRQMDVRFIEESDPVGQTLLEVYVAVALAAPYNDFDNH